MYKDSRGFFRAGDAYEAARPGYPPEALDTIYTVSNLEADSLCLDVASGTGKLARGLSSQRLRVFALDQAWPMLLTMRKIAPALAAAGGKAEELPFVDQSFDIITIGQAFQWFSGNQALREFFRTLRKHGLLWLVWNKRDTNQEWVKSIEAIVGQHRRDAPEWMDKDWKNYIDGFSIFSPVQCKRIKWERSLDIDTVLETVRSRSYISLLSPDEKLPVLREVRARLEDYVHEDPSVTLKMYYETYLFWCRKH